MIRRFRSDPIPPEILTRVLETGLHGPSAGFAQGLELVLLDEPTQIQRFWQITDPAARKRGRREDDPPVILIPLSNKTAYLKRYSEPDKAGLGMEVEEGWPVPYWDLDAAMAIMLILLAATDEGLGAWLFGIFRGERELLGWLSVPPGRRPLGAIALGYPHPSERRRGSALTRSRRTLDEVLHRGTW